MEYKVFSWNARSLRPKRSELHTFLNNNPTDILLLSETWLRTNEDFSIPNFSSYRIDRPRGGVAIFIKSSIPHSNVKKFSLENAEAISVTIHDPLGDFTVFSIYISPQSKRATFQTFFSKILNTPGSLVIAGDFNCKHRAWNNVSDTLPGKDLFKLCSLLNYKIHVPDDTTVIPPARGIPSTIDFAISKSMRGISNLHVYNALSSDHLPVCFTIPSALAKEQPNLTFNYKKADWKKFRSIVDAKCENLSSLPLESEHEIDSAVSLFTNAILEAEEASVPKKSPYRFRYAFSDELGMLTRYRNQCRNKFKRTLDPMWKSLWNQANSLISKATSKLNQSSFSDKLASLKIRDGSLYGLAKSLKNKNSSLPPLKKSDDSLAYSPQIKAQALADAFLQCHQTTHDLVSPLENEVSESTDQLQTLKNRLNADRLSANRAENSQTNLRPVSRSGSIVTLDSVGDRRPTWTKLHNVRQAIKALKVKKASGPDKLSNRVLKSLPKSAVQLITKIFNACWSLAYFPLDWKVAKIIAIPKRDKDASIPTNYRPISLISNVGKLFERLILNELNYHESIQKIFIPQQFGFRTGHSTDQQILRITERAAIGFNHNESTGLVLLDLEKAFDSVWHNGLLHKLMKLKYQSNCF